MNFIIVTHVIHKKKDNLYYAYGPYVREMNLWIEYAEKVIIVAPLSKKTDPDPIDIPYFRSKIVFVKIPQISFTTYTSSLISMFNIPYIILKILYGCSKANHIHLRCPGNIGLLGLLVQTLFPWKSKTVKYAGEWPNYPREPLSYRLQKWLAKNTFFSKNTKVLVYGKWPNFTKNCVSFFTASYSDDLKKIKPVKPEFSVNRGIPVRLLFVGTLDERKRPDYAIEVTNLLRNRGISVTLDILGSGSYLNICDELIRKYELNEVVKLHGNIPPQETIHWYINSHFLVFLTRMEGWPKVVAESMFWGCIPVTTSVSCIPWMLGYGERGCIVKRDPFEASNVIFDLLNNQVFYSSMVKNGIQWSQQFTLERFKFEIIQLLK